MARWPRRPPAGTRCDAHNGSGYDQTGKPVVFRCSKLASETCIDRIGFENWLCEGCAESLAERGDVQRNPRLYPKEKS